MKKNIFAASFIFISLWNAPALADHWPQLEYTGAERPAECAQALQFAEAAFRSNAFRLYYPIRTPQNLVFGPDARKNEAKATVPETGEAADEASGNTGCLDFADSAEGSALSIPADFGSDLVLAATATDISGGDGALTDPERFDESLLIYEDKYYGSRYLHWLKIASNGHHLALVARPFNWRGDTYSLFAPAENILPEEFWRDLNEDSPNENKRESGLVIEDAFRPPLIFRAKDSGRYWIIDPDVSIVGKWLVSIVEPTGVEQRCTVRFYKGEQETLALLPPEVRRLENLLDATMGSGADEGTLQPTALLHHLVQIDWINAMLRPWALGGYMPYNTREKVVEGLKAWAKQGASYRRLHQDILRQYPLAERALARYYQKRFRLSPAAAKKRAVWGLDIVFRQHYVFPGNACRHANPNPWR
ncbi:MAG: hypothetical protein LBT71_08790 [Azoarcus sp.]|jgi:hypothetical protein|nr:hypothetical protein [Azoarcus sp.]